MKQWKVIYSAEATSDLMDIDNYIRNQLQVPKSADEIIDKIMSEIDKLDSMPKRYSVYPEDPWYSIGLRFFPVKNRNVFYFPNDETGIVQIIRILSSKQNPSNVLPTKL